MQVCTYHEYIFYEPKDAYHAFAQIGKGPGFLDAVEGVVSVKLMGTGSGNGFSILPNLERYAIFIIWDSLAAAMRFLSQGSALDWYDHHASSKLLVTLMPTKTHGAWGGVNPIIPSPVSNQNPHIAVLTRATIRPSKLFDFWRNVPKVSKFMSSAEGVLHRIGIGEYPLFMQATFSIWTDKEKLMDAAYKNTAHAEAVRLTRARNWYAEEMFTQFEVLSMSRKGTDYQLLPEF